MRELVENTVALVHAVRVVDPAQWVLRLVLFGALTGSGLLCALWVGGPLVTPLLVVVVGLSLWAVARPGSPAALVVVGVVAVWWLFGGAAQWWQASALAGLLAVAHVTCTYAEAAPSYAAVRRSGQLRILGLGLGYLAACAAGVALVLAVAVVPAGLVARGPVWVGLALVALVGAGILAVTSRRSS